MMITPPKPAVPGQRTSPEASADRGRPLWLLLTGAALLVLGVVEALLIHGNPTHPPWQGADDAWRRAMESSRVGVLTGFGEVVDVVAGPIGSILIVLALVVAFVVVKRRHAAVFLVVVAVATTVVAQTLKKAVDRPRPVHPLVKADPGSFPSGHTVFVAGTAVALVAILTVAGARWLGVVLGVLAIVLIAWDRTYLGAHWISDTVGGVLLGGGTAFLLWWLMYPYLESEPRSTSR